MLEVAVRQIVARGMGGRITKQGERIDIPIGVHLTSNSASVALETLWNSFQGLKAKSGGWRFPLHFAPGEDRSDVDCTFVLGPFEIRSYGRKLPSPSALVVEEIVTSSDQLVVSELNLTAVIAKGSTVEAKNAVMSGRLLQRILCASGCPEDSRADLQELVLTCSLGIDVQIARIWSAIAETQTTSSLTLMECSPFNLRDRKPATGVFAWQCLAHALFSRHTRARSSITNVMLNGFTMTEAEADAVAQVLASPDPTILLFGRFIVSGNGRAIRSGQDDGNTRLVPAMLKRGSFITLEHMDTPGGFTDWLLATDVHGVEVIGHRGDDDTAIVLVPGYGVCRVSYDQVLPSVDSSTRSNGGVTSLHMAFDQDTTEAPGLWRFLGLI